MILIDHIFKKYSEDTYICTFSKITFFSFNDADFGKVGSDLNFTFSLIMLAMTFLGTIYSIFHTEKGYRSVIVSSPK